MEEEKVDALDEVKEVEENSDYDDDGKEQPTDPASLEVGTPPLTPAVPEPERTHMDIASPVASAQILSQGEVSETVFVESNTVIHGQEEESFSNPVTAADGLEMLTRIVENESLANESLANSPSTFTQQTTTQVIVEVSEDQPGSPEPLGDNDAEIRQSNHELDEHPEPSSKHESIDIDPGNDEVNLAALSPAFTEPLETAQENESNDTDLGNGETNLVSPSPVVTEQLESTRGTESLVTDPGTDEVNLIAPSPTSSEHHEPPTAQKIEAPTIGTFSPPLSQSFQSFQSPLEQNSSTAPVQETTFDIESQTAVGQLPTPLETQNTGIALSVGSPFASPTDTQPVDQQVFELQDIEVLPETPDDILQREALMSMDVDVGDEEEVITSEKQQEQEPELSHEEKSPSPALSIESQFDSISPPVDSEQKYQSHRTIIIAESPVATTPYDSLMELDDELQASILEFSQPDDASSDEVSQDKDSDMQSQIAPNEITGESFMEDAEDNMSLVDSTEESHHSDHAQEAVDEAGNQVITEHNEANKMAQTNDVARAPTMPERGQEIQVEIPTNASTWPERSQSLEVEIPSRRVPSTISAQLQRNFIEEEDHHAESETLAQNDPSVHLARAANAAKRLTKSHHSSPVNENRRQTRSFNAHRSPSPDVEDASANLARASFNSQPPKEEDSYSMTAVKLSLARHLRDNLPDCTSLQILRQHLTKSLDVIAVAVMETSEPRRSKTRDFIMSFTVTDQSIGPHAVVEVRIARPHIESLPEVKCGDVVLLRNFKVTSLAKKGFGLQSKKEGSSWAVFDRENEPALIKGAPVEYGKVETDYVDLLREWFSLLDEKARDKLDTVNQEIMEKF
ncbi:hypothetical protein F5Y18DRAFT_397685 [Xylariaceae sp. FL1019]|nr:hypothetical protein F5Y18DRAFT_397685 [Xylariaceae sp. FL1019]